MASLDKYNTDQDFGFTAVDELDIASATSPPPTPALHDEALEEIRGQLSELSEYIQRFAEKFAEGCPRKTAYSTEDVENRLREVEELIMPLLHNLMKNPEKEYILWPNRQTQIQKQIDKILTITRKGVDDGSN